jgi:NitT/TauT family transport system permease protein/sulfonate transport system permease protein
MATMPRRRDARDSESQPGPLLKGVIRTLGALQQMSLIFLLLVLWEGGVRMGWIDGNLFPPPSKIFQALVDLAKLGMLWKDIKASVWRVGVGFMIASVCAIALATLLARWTGLAKYVMPIIDLVRPISVIAWIPIAILWFGLGDKPAWFIIFLGAFFPIFTNTYLGIRSVQPIHVQAAECLGAGRVLFLRKVLLPSALPYILAGMRVGLGVGWMCVIAAELIAATSGLGYMIQTARVLIETEKVLAGMVTIGVIGYAMNHLMLMLERKLTPWSHHAQ